MFVSHSLTSHPLPAIWVLFPTHQTTAVTVQPDHIMYPADLVRKRHLPFDGTLLSLVEPSMLLFLARKLPFSPIFHFLPSDACTQSRGKHSRWHWEYYFKHASSQLMPAQAFYKMLGIIIVPPSSPRISTSQQWHPQQSFSTPFRNPQGNDVHDTSA